MDKTLEDIRFMLAKIWLFYDGCGADAESHSEYLTLSERYGVFISNADEAYEIVNNWKR